MQALLLAAGMGKRLGKYTEGQTKCMVRVGGKTLLEHAADALRAAGIRKLTIVVGHAAQGLMDFARERLSDLELRFIENRDYAVTNNIYSLYLARDVLAADDTILLESDLIFEPQLIQKLVEHPEPNVVTVAKYEQWMDGTVTRVSEHNHILEFIDKSDFRFENADEYYKTVNVYKFSRAFSREKYIPFLTAYITAYGKISIMNLRSRRLRTCRTRSFPRIRLNICTGTRSMTRRIWISRTPFLRRTRRSWSAIMRILADSGDFRSWSTSAILSIPISHRARWRRNSSISSRTCCGSIPPECESSKSMRAVCSVWTSRTFLSETARPS